MTHSLLIYRGHASEVSAVAWSSDGLRLASSSLREVHLWDAALGQHLATYAGHFNHVRRVAWSPDGTRLAFNSRQEAQVWNTQTHRPAFICGGYSLEMVDLAWSPPGRAERGRDGAGVGRRDWGAALRWL